LAIDFIIEACSEYYVRFISSCEWIPMNDQEFSPSNSAKRVLSRWWMVVIFMVLGGLVGLLFHLFFPPVYEARAVITVNMEFQLRELTQIEADTAFNAASAIITSQPVMNRVIAAAQEKGDTVTPSRFLSDFYLEARQSIWELSVRDRDPNAAADLTNIWAQISTDALNSALTHALQADQVRTQIAGLENCLAGTIPQTASVQLDCKGYSNQIIEKMLEDQTTALVTEKKSSLGIISIMTMSLTDPAIVPHSPIQYGQAGIVLAGAFIGLFISLWMINIIKVPHHG
jgi:hypothetical protein